MHEQISSAAQNAQTSQQAAFTHVRQSSSLADGAQLPVPVSASPLSPLELGPAPVLSAAPVDESETSPVVVVPVAEAVAPVEVVTVVDVVVAVVIAVVDDVVVVSPDPGLGPPSGSPQPSNASATSASGSLGMPRS